VGQWWRSTDGVFALDGSSVPTIADVAQAAGVSVSTVSRVINGKGDVSARADAAVRRAMAETGYRVSPVARSLVGARSHLLGFHARAVADEYISALLDGVVEVADDAGYGVLLIASSSRPDGPAARLIQTLPDGVLVVAPFSDEAILGAISPGKPLAYVEPQEAGLAGVTAANREGTYEVTRYLIRLGHRRIGFTAGRLALLSTHDRLEGYRAALTEAGITPDPGLVARITVERGGEIDAVRHLLARPDRPTAIVASNDVEAVATLTAAREAGLRVPEDLSVTGFDDLPIATNTWPQLTTVHQPLREMGRTVAGLLVSRLDGDPATPATITLPTHLVVRGSTGPPPAPP
jgi:LacI family transcriptional regulator